MTGSAPVSSTVLSCLASSAVKLPEISVCPSVMGSLTRGADWTTPSSTIATCLPTLAVVYSPHVVGTLGVHRDVDLDLTGGRVLGHRSVRDDLTGHEGFVRALLELDAVVAGVERRNGRRSR